MAPSKLLGRRACLVCSEFSTPQLASLSFPTRLPLFFCRGRVELCSVRDVQLQAEAIDTQEDCTRLPDSRSILSPNSRHHHSLAPSGAPFIRSSVPRLAFACALLDDIARPSPPPLFDLLVTTSASLPSPDGPDPSLRARYIQTKSTPQQIITFGSSRRSQATRLPRPANLCSHCLMFS